jgi:hypothetical protein
MAAQTVGTQRLAALMGDPDVLLRRAPDLVVTLLSDGCALLRTAHETVMTGPHTLAVLDLFRQPRSLSDALGALQVRGPQEFIEASSLLVQLRRAGVLIYAAAPVPIARMPGFDSPSIHARMLDDEARTRTFVGAIRDVVRPGDVVVDIGTGTGILAMAAAQAGARHVYAIESGAIALAAREIIEANGLGDRVTVLHGRSTAVTLPERADVLVSETIGDDPFSEGIVETLHDARRRLLAPGGRVIPRSLAVRVLPVDVPRDFLESRTVMVSSVERWRAAYGIDFSPLASYAARAGGRLRVALSEARTWPVVGDAVTLVEKHLAETDETPVEARADVAIASPAAHLGLLCTFDAVVAPGHVLSTRPDRSSASCHWQALIAYVAHRPLVAAGEIVRVAYSCSGGSPDFRVT